MVSCSSICPCYNYTRREFVKGKYLLRITFQETNKRYAIMRQWLQRATETFSVTNMKYNNLTFSIFLSCITRIQYNIRSKLVVLRKWWNVPYYKTVLTYWLLNIFNCYNTFTIYNRSLHVMIFNQPIQWMLITEVS